MLCKGHAYLHRSGMPRSMHYVLIQLTTRITYAFWSLVLSLSYLPALRLFFKQEFRVNIKQDKMEFSAQKIEAERLRKDWRNVSPDTHRGMFYFSS